MKWSMKKYSNETDPLFFSIEHARIQNWRIVGEKLEFIFVNKKHLNGPKGLGFLGLLYDILKLLHTFTLTKGYVRFIKQLGCLCLG